MMAISTLSEVTGYAFRAQTASADLTAPPNPAPVTLPAGSTALGSTLIGSWSAPVAVVATCTTDTGAPGPAVTVTGSGAGPYSISIASGLTTATSYIVTLAGTAADGQVAETCLLVVVAGVTTDLIAPATPSPVSLSAGSTALGSTLIGSWSASVTVAALVIPRSGPAPTATVTGSGAGPYSVSIASGLSDGGSYLVILTGTAADGQVASTSLLVAVATPADLTAPLPPPPVSLAAGSTSLGSTAIGSWSAAVTVTANVSGSDGSSPVATVTGSGAGPYSVSIASGLTDGVTYAVTLSGTGADGQVARVGLSVAVRQPVVGTLDWNVVADYDLTTIDTAAPTTGTAGSITLTVGGVPFLTLTDLDGTGTGSITPTNGVGLVFAVTTTGRRSIMLDLNWPALGVSNVFRRIFAVEAQASIGNLANGAAGYIMMASAASSATTNSNIASRCTYNGTVYSINARTYHSGAVNDTADTTVASPPAAWSASVMRCPEGIEICHGLTTLPANPDLQTFVGRRRSQDFPTFVKNGALRLGTNPKLALELFGNSGANSSMTISRLRISVMEVV
jgi:hypothetical protein